MTLLIESDNISSAWLQAMLALQKNGGEMANLIVSILPNPTECKAVTVALDRFLSTNPKAFSLEKVAGTIFPWELYLPELLGLAAQTHLYENHQLVRLIERRFNKKGNYFDRMVCWPGPGGTTVNQLEKKISDYRNAVARGCGTHNAFEISLSPVTDDSYSEVAVNDLEREGEDIRLYDPNLDRSIMGFPCLSHISISLIKHKLHMTATYRNQFFIQKAYANYLGLYRLLAFLAREIGVETGELACVATHADDEAGSNKWTTKSAVNTLLADCKQLLAQTPFTPAETTFSRINRETHLKSLAM